MRLLAAAFLALAAMTAAASAAVVNFSFSFTNIAVSNPTVVHGLILGLQDDATGLPTSVRVTEGPFGVGEYTNPNDPFGNTFTVAGGQLTSFVFDSQGRSNYPPSQTCCSLFLANDLVGFPGNRAALVSDPTGTSPPQVSDLVIAPYTGETPPAPIPLPAPFLMLASALAALGFLGRRQSAWAALARNRRHLAALSVLLGFGAAFPASAASFAFQFDNGGQGPVGVEIRGLVDDSTSSATSVQVTLNDGGGYGLGEYLSATSAATNTFTMVDGSIISFDFNVFGGNNTLPSVYCCTLAFSGSNITNVFAAGLSNQPESVNPSSLDQIVFIPIDGTGTPAPIPLPSPLLTLLSGVAALGFFGWRRRPSITA